MNDETNLTPDPQPLRKVTEDLPCTLTDEDRVRIADRMATIPLKIAEVDRDLRAHELAFENSKARHKAAKGECEGRRIELETELAQIGTAWRDGIEVRPVEVDELAHYDTGMIERVRTDTAETIGSRSMNDSERQMQLVPQDDDDEVDDEAPLDGDVKNAACGALDGVKVDKRGDFVADDDPELGDGYDDGLDL
jgi:hypothetical protein